MFVPLGLQSVAAPWVVTLLRNLCVLPATAPKGTWSRGIPCRIECWPMASKGGDNRAPSAKIPTAEYPFRVACAVLLHHSKGEAASTGPAGKITKSSPGSKDGVAAVGPTLKRSEHSGREAIGPAPGGTKEETASKGPLHKRRDGLTWTLVQKSGSSWGPNKASHAPAFRTSPDASARS
jgi:hypothetical protein